MYKVSRFSEWVRVLGRLLSYAVDESAHPGRRGCYAANLVNQSNPILRFRDEDRELFPIPELSRRARVSQGFVRHCIDLGCPAPEQRLSQEILLNWLVMNYTRVRAGAGLPELASIEGVTGRALSRLRLANAVVTLLDYSESRSSAPDEKQQIKGMRVMVERALERR